MKTRLLLLAFTSLSFFGLAQKQNSKPLYTFCGKAGDCTMSYDEFKKCEKELTAADKNVTIVSFVVSAKIFDPSKKESLFEDHPNKGSSFSKTSMDVLEKAIAEKHLDGSKILIEEVLLLQDGKSIKAPGMVIQLK